jgi:uncharacterized protein (DUF952 family)
MSLIYKIVPAVLWQEAERLGRFDGAPIDRADGFIHFSTGAQAGDTAARHFAGQDGLLLVAVEADDLGPALRWEVSRGGALFPHLYGPLVVTKAVSIVPLAIGPDGTHVFPPLA